MRISRSFTLLILVLFFAGSLSVASGCTAGKGRQTPAASPVIGSPPPTSRVVGAADASCSSLGGDICTAGEECRGSWITASDGFNCCSQSCSGTVPGETLTIEPFDTLVENDDLGPLA